jgi:two-component system sensor histidine kinase DegS
MKIFKSSYLRSPHFWIVVTISILLFFLYRYWPWREAQLGTELWRYLPYLENLSIFELKSKFIGSLFTIPIIYGILAFGWRRALFIWLGSLVLVLPSLLSIWKTPEHLTMNLLYFLFPVCVSSLIYLEYDWRSRVKNEFAEREKERSLYLSQIIEAQENERSRIAYELHDDTVQTLIALANQLENLLSRQSDAINELNLVRDEIHKSIEDIQLERSNGTVQSLESAISRTEKVLSLSSERINEITFSRDITLDTVENLRSICINLRPATLDKLGLIPALRALANLMCQNYKIDTRIAVKGNQCKISSQTEVTLYRVVQEALSNVRNHSRATYAQVTIEFCRDHLKIIIEDNGEGFNTIETLNGVTSQNKMGLTGMKERLKLVDGVIDVNSMVGMGTAISIEVPLSGIA